MDKRAIRLQAKEIRSNIPDRQQKERALWKQLEQHPAFLAARGVASFVSFGTEVDTGAINQMILAQKNLYLPRVTGERIQFHQMTDLGGQLQPGAFGILEPDERLPVATDFDLILVPGLAFTERGERLGYGGGFYDRYLGECSAYSLGLCFGAQMVETLPTEGTDIPLDGIVTEEATFARDMGQ